jgi:hypothetical protein
MLCTSHQYLFAVAPAHRASTQEIFAIVGASKINGSIPIIFTAMDVATGVSPPLATAHPGMGISNYQDKAQVIMVIQQRLIATLGFEGGIIIEDDSLGSIFAHMAGLKLDNVEQARRGVHQHSGQYDSGRRRSGGWHQEGYGEVEEKAAY